MWINIHLKIVSWITLLDTVIGITLVPPKLIPLSRSAQLRKGERYHITCSTSDGSPPLTFTWSKNGESLDSEGSSSSNSDIVVRKLDDFSTSLVVENVQENHAGNYSCTASNTAGRDAGTTSLLVLYPPSWIRSPADTSVTSGTKITLPCEASGSPRPTITWRRNTDFSAMNFDIIHSDGRLRISDDGQSLMIPESKKQDEGFYECHVTNGVGDQLRKTVRIAVQVPPKVNQAGSEIVIQKGKDITVHCNMSGDPPLHILWEKNGKTIESRTKQEIQEMPTDTGVATSLTLTHVDRGTSGLYICKVKNSFGEAHRIINLDVVEHPGPPKDLTVSQVWSRSLQLSWATPYSGNRAILAYIIHYWKTEGKSEPPPDKPHVLRIESLQTTAVISDLLPNTIYSILVTAENEVGQSSPSQPVTGTTKEEEPDWSATDVTILEKHASSIKLQWKCPQIREWTAPLKGFYIGYRKMNSKTTYTYRSLEVDTCAHPQQYMLFGLQSETSYTVLVKAYNNVGVGPSSEQIVVHTANGGHPRSPHMKLINSTGVICYLKIWPKEYSKNLPTSFILHIREKDEDVQKIFVPVLSSKNYTVGGLNPITEYFIFATAKNEFGESTASQVVKITTGRTDPLLMELQTEQNYDKMYFILPIVLSALTIVVLPVVACYCLQKSTTRQMQADSIEVRDFIYNAATIARMDATMRRASATLARQRMASLPRPPKTGRVETTTLPTPDQPQQAIVEPAPTLPTSYSTLQNYGTATPSATAVEVEPLASPKEEEAPSPERNKTPDDARYDSVVEEMRTLIKEGVTRPKKAIVEESPSDESS